MAENALIYRIIKNEIVFIFEKLGSFKKLFSEIHHRDESRIF